MNMKRITFITSLLLSSCAAFAASPITTNTSNEDSIKFGIQSAIASGGDLSIGIAAYTPYLEFGVTGGAQIIDANHDNDTNSFVPAVFFGGRYHITKETIFAYGVNFVDVFGKENGIDIDINYTVGAYVSLEQMLTPHVMLSLWVDPYAFNYKKLEGFDATKSHNFFNTGGIGLEYLF